MNNRGVLHIIMIILNILNLHLDLIEGYVVETKTVTSCRGSILVLACPENSIINIKSIMLGDSDCYANNCCPKKDDCKKSASYKHIDITKNRCNKKSLCKVAVEVLSIYCNLFTPSNDYEVITYDCVTETTTIVSTKDYSTAKLIYGYGQLTSLGTNEFISAKLNQTRNKFEMETNTNQSIGHNKHTNKMNQSSQRPIDEEYVLGENTIKDRGIYSELLQARGSRDNSGLGNSKLDKLEIIVVTVISGVILVTIIISVSCLISKRYRIKERRQALEMMQMNQLQESLMMSSPNSPTNLGSPLPCQAWSSLSLLRNKQPLPVSGCCQQLLDEFNEYVTHDGDSRYSVLRNSRGMIHGGQEIYDSINDCMENRNECSANNGNPEDGYLKPKECFFPNKNDAKQKEEERYVSM